MHGRVRWGRQVESKIKENRWDGPNRDRGPYSAVQWSVGVVQAGDEQLEVRWNARVNTFLLEHDNYTATVREEQ